MYSKILRLFVCILAFSFFATNSAAKNPPSGTGKQGQNTQKTSKPENVTSEKFEVAVADIQKKIDDVQKAVVKLQETNADIQKTNADVQKETKEKIESIEKALKKSQDKILPDALEGIIKSIKDMKESLEDISKKIKNIPNTNTDSENSQYDNIDKKIDKLKDSIEETQNDNLILLIIICSVVGLITLAAICACFIILQKTMKKIEDKQVEDNDDMLKKINDMSSALKNPTMLASVLSAKIRDTVTSLPVNVNIPDEKISEIIEKMYEEEKRISGLLNDSAIEFIKNASQLNITTAADLQTIVKERRVFAKNAETLAGNLRAEKDKYQKDVASVENEQTKNNELQTALNNLQTISDAQKKTLSTYKNLLLEDKLQNLQSLIDNTEQYNLVCLAFSFLYNIANHAQGKNIKDEVKRFDKFLYAMFESEQGKLENIRNSLKNLINGDVLKRESTGEYLEWPLLNSSIDIEGKDEKYSTSASESGSTIVKVESAIYYDKNGIQSKASVHTN